MCSACPEGVDKCSGCSQSGYGPDPTTTRCVACTMPNCSNCGSSAAACTVCGPGFLLEGATATCVPVSSARGGTGGGLQPVGVGPGGGGRQPRPRVDAAHADSVLRLLDPCSAKCRTAPSVASRLPRGRRSVHTARMATCCRRMATPPHARLPRHERRNTCNFGTSEGCTLSWDERLCYVSCVDSPLHCCSALLTVKACAAVAAVL